MAALKELLERQGAPCVRSHYGGHAIVVQLSGGPDTFKVYADGVYVATLYGRMQTRLDLAQGVQLPGGEVLKISTGYEGWQLCPPPAGF